MHCPTQRSCFDPLPAPDPGHARLDAFSLFYQAGIVYGVLTFPSCQPVAGISNRNHMGASHHIPHQ